MKYLLDTNICIYLMKSVSASAMAKFRTIPEEDVGISCLTVCELQYGVSKSAKVAANQSTLDDFLRDFAVAPFTQDAGIHYGRLRASLERAGKAIGALDTLIASHALSLGACLVTNNRREFSRVPGLKTENWIAS